MSEATGFGGFRVGERVRVRGSHPWSGYAGVLSDIWPDTESAYVQLDCGLRAVVASPALIAPEAA